MGVERKGINMKKKTKFTFKSKYILAILTVFCLGMILLTFTTDVSTGPLKTVSGIVIMPLQKGINKVGTWLTSNQNYFKRQGDLVAKNKELEERINELVDENSHLLANQSELESLREIFKLAENYKQFDTVGATIISNDTGNWYDTFTIDKGSDQGIQKDMNVIAGNGLVGIIIEVGPKWSTVRPIINDVMAVSAQVDPLRDQCTVSGDLLLKDEGKLRITGLTDREDIVTIGDKVVTSNISTKYHEGILIGAIDKLELDPNNTTKSGTIIPAVDFNHLSKVLVITKLKDTYDEERAKKASESPEAATNKVSETTSQTETTSAE
jgi:rod shape-determining protein MreC